MSSKNHSQVYLCTQACLNETRHFQDGPAEDQQNLARTSATDTVKVSKEGLTNSDIFFHINRLSIYSFFLLVLGAA